MGGLLKGCFMVLDFHPKYSKKNMTCNSAIPFSEQVEINSTHLNTRSVENCLHALPPNKAFDETPRCTRECLKDIVYQFF